MNHDVAQSGVLGVAGGLILVTLLGFFCMFWLESKNVERQLKIGKWHADYVPPPIKEKGMHRWSDNFKFSVQKFSTQAAPSLFWQNARQHILALRRETLEKANPIATAALLLLPEEAAGDLAERYTGKCARLGQASANRWYAKQVIASALELLVNRAAQTTRRFLGIASR